MHVVRLFLMGFLSGLAFDKACGLLSVWHQASLPGKVCLIFLIFFQIDPSQNFPGTKAEMCKVPP